MPNKRNTHIHGCYQGNKYLENGGKVTCKKNTEWWSRTDYAADACLNKWKAAKSLCVYVFNLSIVYNVTSVDVPLRTHVCLSIDLWPAPTIGIQRHGRRRFAHSAALVGSLQGLNLAHTTWQSLTRHDYREVLMHECPMCRGPVLHHHGAGSRWKEDMLPIKSCHWRQESDCPERRPVP